MLKPLGDRVLVEPLEPEAKSAGGIYLPEGAQEAPRAGKVIAVGPGRKTEEGKVVPLDVKVGDIVMYTKYGGNEIKMDGKEYLLIEEHSLLALQESDKKK